MEEKIRIQNVERLDIDEKILDVLRENKIHNIGELCRKSNADLKNIGLSLNETKKINIELQLIGLNLKNSL